MKNTRNRAHDWRASEVERLVLGDENDNKEALERVRKNLHRAIEEELTPRQSELLRAYLYEGKSMSQIAREHGVAASTVARTIARARERLARCLKYSF